MGLNQEDTAEELIALFETQGAVNVQQAVTASSASTVTLPDPTVVGYTNLTLSTSSQVPIQLPTPATGKRFRARLIQDSTGSRTVSWTTPSGAIQWVGAAAPTLTTTGGHADIITGECWDGTNWTAQASLNSH